MSLAQIPGIREKEVTDGRMRDIHLNCQTRDLRDPYRAFKKGGRQ